MYSAKPYIIPIDCLVCRLVASQVGGGRREGKKGLNARLILALGTEHPRDERGQDHDDQANDKTRSVFHQISCISVSV